MSSSQSDHKFFSKWATDMLESPKRQVLDHRASVLVSTSLCTLSENHAIRRMTDCLGNFDQKLVRGQNVDTPYRLNGLKN